MAQVQRRIVHKQFNSPIALYSDVNVKETLDRELKLLNNGAVGIDFDDPTTTRAGKLAKSAVLAALEEEEREKRGQKPGLKRVAWPPPSEEATYHIPVEQQNSQPQNQQISQQQSLPVQNQQVPQKDIQSTANYAPVAFNQPPKAPQQQRPVSIHSFSSLQSQAPSKPLSPLPLLQTSSPQFHTPVYGSPRGWAHVDSPRSPGAVHQQQKKPYNTAPIASPPFEMTHSTSSLGQPQYQTNVAPQPTHAMQQNQQNYAYQSPSAPQQQPSYAPAVQSANQQLPFQGNALRKEAPISQDPAPIFQAQPVTTSFQGGSNRRGDLRWPPMEYKQQAAEENEARRQLALGPAFRPKRCNKVDYSQFFAQNALSKTYPGYRIPPTVYTTHVNE